MLNWSGRYESGKRGFFTGFPYSRLLNYLWITTKQPVVFEKNNFQERRNNYSNFKLKAKFSIEGMERRILGFPQLSGKAGFHVPTICPQSKQ